MVGKKWYFLLIACAALMAYLFLAGVIPVKQAQAQQACQAISSPSQIQAPSLITFDDLPNNAVIGDHYKPGYGVHFDSNTNPQAIAFADTPANVHTPPNVAFFNPTPPVTSAGIPLTITFDQPKEFVGMYVGNGDGRTVATLTGYSVTGGIICRAIFQGIGDPVNTFLGFYDPDGGIVMVRLDYGDTSLSETIDDLFLSPAGAAPTRTPMPTWTPVPTLSPTAGPNPTATPVVPLYAYKPFNPVLVVPILQSDLSIHGIEITQGIQCFNTSQGLTSCPDNSLTLVNKKDTTARIYLKATGLSAPVNNVPVRLHIRANNVWYQVDALGNATGSINQANRDDAEIYFNVNFNSNVVVDFYAEVDPNHVIAETNEGNNCFPTPNCASPAPYLTRTFQNGVTKKIVGYRLHYHPSGYAGTQDAAGWAVNGGGADWMEQVLPMRNNGINYSLRSGYLDWTTSLSSGDGQHALIQNLNALWTLENVFSFWFSGAFTGARHVYGWAPSAGYSGGHADMPIYPHAGGLGKVGIGSDAPGTNTDNPGSGALIFAHELVHDYNVFHTNTSDACGSNDSNSDFPYSSSSIQEFGFNPFTGKIYNPSSTHDLMSYCPSGGSKAGWISPFTWNKMFSLLPTTNLPAGQVSLPVPEVMAPTASQESLVVNATIYNPRTQPPVPGVLNDMHRVATGVSLCPESPGPYAIQLRDASDNLLVSCPFDVNFESEYDPDAPAAHSSPDSPPPFPPEDTSQEDINQVLPWVLGTSKVVLVYQPGGQQPDVDLVTEQVSANPPVVTITSPSGVESWSAGSTHALQWTGFDADGDPLTYALFYSYDSGATWELVQDGITATHYDVHTDLMKGGSDVRFRVEATDGINTGFDETNEAITIPNHAPDVILLNPLANQIYPFGDLIILQGSANDFEDGALPDASLVWTDNLQGGLGIGPSVPLNTLTPGKHTITLTASDSLNISSSQSVTIVVAYPTYLPLSQK